MAKNKYPRVTTPAGKAHWVHLDAPDDSGEYADGKFKVTLTFPKDGGPDLGMVERGIAQAVAENWGPKVTRYDSPIRDGDEPTDSKPQGRYPGCWYLTAKTRNKPPIVGPGRNPATGLPEPAPASQEPPRSGDLLRLACICYPYQAGASKGVSLQINGVCVCLDPETGERGTNDFRPDVAADFGADPSDPHQANRGRVFEQDDHDDGGPAF